MSGGNQYQENLENSKIVVFKDGILTKIEETLNSFK